MENQNTYSQENFFEGVFPCHHFQEVTVVFHLHLGTFDEEHTNVPQDECDVPSLCDAAREEGHGGLDAPHHSLWRHEGGCSYPSILQRLQYFVAWKITQKGRGISTDAYQQAAAMPQPPGPHGASLQQAQCLEPVVLQVLGPGPPGHVSRGAAGAAHRARCGTCSAVSSLVVSSISYSPMWERKARGLLTQPRSGERAPHSTARNTSRGHLTWHICLVIRQGVTFSEVPGQVEDRSLHSQVASSNPHPLEDGVKGAKGGNANALRADETNRVVR